MRKSVDETWAHLETQGRRMPRDPEGRPLVSASMPSNDDDDGPSFSFFRTRVQDDWSGLSLPRTYFGRSLVKRASFADTDLSESRMCWNDFDDCDFAGADLSGCDMRASVFQNCRFIGAVLRGADLRRSSFTGCDFTGADLTGAVADDPKATEARHPKFKRARLIAGEVPDEGGATEYLFDLLSEQQRASMTWTDDLGPEPPGG